MRGAPGWRSAALCGLLLAQGCGGLPSVDCALECPDGTRLAHLETVARGEKTLITSALRETACEPTLRCEVPNAPTVTADRYECKALEGNAGIPRDIDVDFAFAALRDPEGTGPSSCRGGVRGEGELGVDRGGACERCGSCQDGEQNDAEVDVDCGGAEHFEPSAPHRVTGDFHLEADRDVRHR